MVVVGDLAQRHDRVLVVVAVDRDLGAGRDHPRAVARQQHEIEAVFDLVDAVFDGDAGHGLVAPATERCREILAVRYPPREPKAQVRTCD